MAVRQRFGQGLWILLASGVAAFAATPAAPHSLGEFEESLFERERYVEFTHGEAPGFELMDAEGRSVGLEDLRAKVVVLNFIYATCPDVCPLHADRIAEVQEKVNATPMSELVQFVSVTTDPLTDTPEKLKAYAGLHGLDPANWIFLTSGPERPEATRRLAEGYGLKFTRTGEGAFVHAVVTFLIDRSGILRARYHGLKFNTSNMVLHLNALVNDQH